MCFQLEAQTFAKDVAPIIFNKCTVCHRPGEIGPMSFTNYEEVKNWSNMIKYVTEIRYMPPWKADPNYSHFLEENYLTDEQIELIGEWVDSGSPYGDASDEPPLPDFPDGSQLGEPDLILSMAEAHLHRGNNRDSYYYFVLPTGLTEDKYVKAIELRPGNPQIVHHCLFFEDLSGAARREDEKSPEYGFNGFGDFGIEQVLAYEQYPGYVPGTKPRYFPDGQGQIMHAGGDLVIQMHYAPWPVDATDRSVVNIFFADEEEEVDRQIKDHIMLPLPETIGEFFYIPANSTRTFHGIWSPTSKISLMGVSPHMHYLGTGWEVYIEHADGSISNMIKIPEWDFNWQGDYYFDRVLVVEPGDRIHAIAGYDNTVNNPSNPSNPPINVQWGEGTEDEMYYLPIYYLDYRIGDENVVYTGPTSIEEIDKERPGLKVYPNPITKGEDVFIELNISHAAPYSIELHDSQGRLIRRLREQEFFRQGSHVLSVKTHALESQQYFIKLIGNDAVSSVSFIKI